MAGKENLIVALDYDSMEEVKALLAQIPGQVGYYKVGLQLFSREGPEAIRLLRGQGEKVFADLKLHDIPNTVAQATRALTALGANIIDVHVSGGSTMMKAACEAAQETAEKYGIPKPAIIGVTVLTSFDEEGLMELGLPGENVTELAVKWALLAQKAGLDGIVASPIEARAIREICGPDFMIVTPGIRPSQVAAHDQKRITTPRKAIQSGASHLVVGRAITQAQEPSQAIRSILKEMEE